MESHYRKLGLAISINTVVMFLLTYALIARMEHFYPNINRVYMALLMALPMVVVMLVVMRSMYDNQRRNRILLASSLGGFVLLFVLARTQTPVGNDQFLRSMIPHHSSAMCQQASLTDAEILALSTDIVKAQEREIAQMKAILERY